MSRLVALLGFLCVLSGFLFGQVEIVVTASRIEEDARTAPAYVRVIPEEEIAQGNTLLDALNHLPDILIRSTSPGKESISTGAFGEGGHLRTLVLIDGRPINPVDLYSINWRSIPLDQIARVEVVKGPLSSQYGDKAVAGAINIIMKKPDGFDLWIRGNVSTDKSNHQGIGMSWSNKTFRAQGNLSREKLQPARERSESSILAADLSVGISLENFDIDLEGTFFDGSFQLPGGLSKDEFDTDPNKANNKADSAKEQRYGTVLSSDISVGQFNINPSVEWNHRENQADTRSFSSWTDTTYDDIQASVQSDVKLLFGDSIALTPVFGIDTQWSQINVKKYDVKERTNITLDETPSRFDIGFWGRAKALIGTSWTVDAGLRLSHYTVSMNSESVTALPFVYDAGVSFVPNDSWAFSTRYGRVFRYPSLNEQASYYGFGTPGVDLSLKPEYGHHVTASAEFRSGKFLAQISPYFIAMTDEIAYVYDPVSKSGGNKNIGSTYHYGALASFAWEGRTILAKASYSFDAAQFVDTLKFVPLVPQHTVYGKVSVRPIESLDISTDGRFSSSYYGGGDIDNSKDMIPGRFEWNVRVEWRYFDELNELTVYAQVVNLLDDRTPTSVYYSSSNAAWYPSKGRSFEIGATIRK